MDETVDKFLEKIMKLRQEQIKEVEDKKFQLKKQLVVRLYNLILQKQLYLKLYRSTKNKKLYYKNILNDISNDIEYVQSQENAYNLGIFIPSTVIKPNKKSLF